MFIATAVDFSIQVQMNQRKIVWLPIWIKCDILSGVVLYLIRVTHVLLWLTTLIVIDVVLFPI